LKMTGEAFCMPKKPIRVKNAQNNAKPLERVRLPRSFQPKLAYLPRPKPQSHKGQNGVLLIIGGGKTYHGAPILSALAAERFCDLAYFVSTDENCDAARKMKFATPNVIVLPMGKLEWALSRADCILVGNGMEICGETEGLVRRVLQSKRKCVLDAAAIRLAEKGKLHEGVILTPHTGEFKALFGKAASPKAAIDASREHGCTVLLKGKTDIVASCGKALAVHGGNAGMTKGGTGDSLAGLCAALYTTCSSPFYAACTASLVNKKAAEMLYRSLGFNYSSKDLAGELAFAAASLYRGKKRHR